VRLMFISLRVGALLMAAALAGCVVAPYGGGYDSHSGYGAVYRSGAHPGRAIHRSSEIYRAYPYSRPGSHTLPHRSGSDRRAVTSKVERSDRRLVAGGLRDWREGDGAFRRKQRELGGVGLEERQRRDRQERVLESRQDNADRARVRRGSGQVETSGSSGQGISEKFDQDVGRRLERASQAERRAQRRAREVRRQLRLESE